MYKKEELIKIFSINQNIEEIKNMFLNCVCFIVDDLSELTGYDVNVNTLIISKNINDKSTFNFDEKFIYFKTYKFEIEVISFAIYLGCKIIFSNKEIPNEEEIYLSDGVNYFNFNNLSNEEFNNILNYKDLIVLRDTDENYSVSSVIRHLIKSFDNIKTSKFFLKNGLKLLTTKNIISGHYVEKDVDNFIENINNKNIFKNLTLFGIHPYGLSKLNLVNIDVKKVLWQDDPHWFANFVDRDGVIVQKFDKKYEIESLNKIDILITPSIKYFENLKITKYNSKIKFIFYTLNTEYYKELNNTFDQRYSKIILSGEINDGYKARKKLKDLSTSKKFENLIDIVDHPGYDNNQHMTEINYYKKLQEYKSAFVGHYNFPLDYPLAKHIEVLMCGCLGFFQKNESLKKELGLEEFVHYIPCTDNNGNLIEEKDFYTDWINSKKGKKVAEQGMKYVRKKFGNENIMNYINVFKSI